jgi:hypothetical protein
MGGHEKLYRHAAPGHLDGSHHAQLFEHAAKVGLLHTSYGDPDVGFGRAQGLLQRESKGLSRTENPRDQGVQLTRR